MPFNTIDELNTKPSIWAIQARVSRSWIATNTKNAVLHRHLILIDEKGSDIWVKVPLHLMPTFEHLFEEQKVYIIRDFRVKFAPQEYRPIANQFTIEVTAFTVVEETEDLPAIPKHNFTFIDESEISKNLGKRALLYDTIGYVVEYRNPQQASANKTWKELILKLSNNFSILILVWAPLIGILNDIVANNGNNTMALIITSIFVRKFKVAGKKEEEIAFSTSSATQFYTNSNIPQIADFVRDNDHQGLAAPIQNDPTDISKTTKVTLDELNASMTDPSNQRKYFLVDCTIQAIQNGWCYTGCEACTKKIEAGLPEYDCCKSRQTKTSQRYRIQLEVYDETGGADLVLLDKLSESLLGTTAQTLYQQNGNDSSTPPQMISKLASKTIKVQVQVNEYNMKTGRNEFTVTKIIEPPTDKKTTAKEPEPVSQKTTTNLQDQINDATVPITTLMTNETINNELSDDNVPIASLKKKGKKRKLRKRKHQVSDEDT